MATSREEVPFHVPSDSDIEFRNVIANGDSLAVTLPAERAVELGIEPHDQVAVRVTDVGRVDIVTDDEK